MKNLTKERQLQLYLQFTEEAELALIKNMHNKDVISEILIPKFVIQSRSKDTETRDNAKLTIKKYEKDIDNINEVIVDYDKSVGLLHKKVKQLRAEIKKS